MMRIRSGRSGNRTSWCKDKIKFFAVLAWVVDGEAKQNRHATGARVTTMSSWVSSTLTSVTSLASPSAGRVEHTYKGANRRRSLENGHEGAALASELSRAGSTLHLVKPSTGSQE